MFDDSLASTHRQRDMADLPQLRQHVTSIDLCLTTAASWIYKAVAAIQNHIRIQI